MSEHPALAAARKVVSEMEADLAHWLSYSGPALSSQRQLEHQLEGARKVLAAVKAAILR